MKLQLNIESPIEASIESPIEAPIEAPIESPIEARIETKTATTSFFDAEYFNDRPLPPNTIDFLICPLGPSHITTTFDHLVLLQVSPL